MAAPARRSTAAWVLYDLANTIFALGVIGLYVPDWLISAGLPDSALALVEATAGIVVIFAAPWIGARSDHEGRRLPALRRTTIAAVAATSLLAAGPPALTLVALGFALVAVNTGAVVYDALLPEVSTPTSRGRVSGLGVAAGYVGSFVGLGIGTLGLDVLGWGHSATFRLLAVAFLLFALPAFGLIDEPDRGRRPGRPPGPGAVVPGLAASWRTASGHPGLVRFLVGRFLYTDAVNTLVGGFLAIFAVTELGLDLVGSRNLLGVAIAFAVVGGLVTGRLVERFGALPVLRLMLVGWLVAFAAGIGFALADTTTGAWTIGAVGGVALGGTWTADRVLMMRLSPPEQLGEMYGLYATVGRFATVLGPLTWTLVAEWLGWGRVAAMGALALFVLAGLVVVSRVEEPPPPGVTSPG